MHADPHAADLAELEDQRARVPGRRRPGIHYSQRGQRRRGHLDLFGRRRAVRLLAALGHDPHHNRARRRAGNGVAHGCGHRQGLERPHSRGVWLPRHIPVDAGARRDELRQYHGGVCRRGQQSGALRVLPLYRRAAGRGADLVSRRARHVRQHREDLSGRLALLRLLHHRRRSGAPGLEDRDGLDADPPRVRGLPQLRLPVHADRSGWNDDCPVDAVLPPVLHRRERRDGPTVSRVAVGRHHRVSVCRDRRLVHHRRVRGDAARRRRSRHPRCGRRRASAPATRGEICVPAVRGRPLQRIALRRVDPADLHLLCRV